MGIVIAKLSRLGRDGDSFTKEFKKEIRSNVKIDSDYIEEFNKNWKTSGQLYEIDKKKTSERNAKVKGVKPEAKKPEVKNEEIKTDK